MPPRRRDNFYAPADAGRLRRVTFFAERKSPKNGARERGFRFPLSLADPFPPTGQRERDVRVPSLWNPPLGVGRAVGSAGPYGGACPGECARAGGGVGARRPTEQTKLPRPSGPYLHLPLLAASARFDNRQNGRTAHPAFQGKSGSAQRSASVQHFGWFVICFVRVGCTPLQYDIRGAAEVLKPQVSSCPFGHFWDCGQK